MKALNALIPVIAFGFALSCTGPSSNAASDVLPDGIVADRSAAYNEADQYWPIVSTYGTPDKEDSTAYDTPRPPLVTRIIEYKAENVRIAFIPVAKADEPPPYVSWTVIGYIDTSTETKLSKYEVAERLKGRLQKRQAVK